MNETQRNVAVGITALAAVIGLITLLLLFGYVPNWLETGYLVTIKLPNAADLHDQSRVSLDGIDVGKVQSIDLEKQPGGGVTVLAKVRDDIRLPQGVRVEVELKLIGGSPKIAILTDQIDWNKTVTFLPTDGSAVIHGHSSSMVDAVLDALKEPLAQLARVGDNIQQLSAEWTQLGKNLNQLTEQRNVEDIDAGLITGNLMSVMVRMDARLTEMRQVLGGVSEYVNDEKLRAQIAATVVNAQQMTSTITESVDNMTKRYIALADDMSHSLDSMTKAIEQARAGEGAMGKFLNDPALYDNINDAALRLNTAMEQLQLLFEKWKAEGIEVGL